MALVYHCLQVSEGGREGGGREGGGREGLRERREGVGGKAETTAKGLGESLPKLSPQWEVENNTEEREIELHIIPCILVHVHYIWRCP